MSSPRAVWKSGGGPLSLPPRPACSPPPERSSKGRRTHDSQSSRDPQNPNLLGLFDAAAEQRLALPLFLPPLPQQLRALSDPAEAANRLSTCPPFKSTPPPSWHVDRTWLQGTTPRVNSQCYPRHASPRAVRAEIRQPTGSLDNREVLEPVYQSNAASQVVPAWRRRVGPAAVGNAWQPPQSRRDSVRMAELR